MYAFLVASVRVSFVVRYHVDHPDRHNMDSDTKREFLTHWATCGRVLFRNGEYININWIGFCVTTAVLLCICCVSYLVEKIHKCGISFFKAVADPQGTIVKIRSIAGRTMQHFRRSSWFAVSAVVGRLHLFWETRFFHNVLRERRTWYGNWYMNSPTLTRGSGNAYSTSAHSSSQDLNGYRLDDFRSFEAIDDPV